MNKTPRTAADLDAMWRLPPDFIGPLAPPDWLYRLFGVAKDARSLPPLPLFEKEEQPCPARCFPPSL